MKSTVSSPAIREAITFYNLSASDLGLAIKPKGPKAAAPVKRRKRKGAAAKTPAVVKYRQRCRWHLGWPRQAPAVAA